MTHNKIRIIFLSILIVTTLIVTTLITACKPIQPVLNVRLLTRSGVVKISIIGIDADTGRDVISIIKNDFSYIDRNLRVGGSGDLAIVNRKLSTGQAFIIPPSLLPLLKLSQSFAARSDGLIDPAIGKIIELWDFNTSEPGYHPVPNDMDIQSLVQAKPKMRDLDLDGLMLRSNNSAVKLDFNDILRGYGIDLAIARLREFGIRNAVVKFDSVLRVIGNRDGQPWKIPINRPTGGVLAFIELSGDESIVTLGIHERNFLYKGKRYHDIIDPRTGYPVFVTKSVTVLHNNTVTAEAAAHALFVAGPKDWIKIASAMRIKYAFLLDKSNVLYILPAMERRLQFLEGAPEIRVSPLLKPVSK